MHRLVVTPLSVVDLPESYKDALAGVTGTFRASFQPISSRLEAFGKVFQPTTLNGGLPIVWMREKQSSGIKTKE